MQETTGAVRGDQPAGSDFCADRAARIDWKAAREGMEHRHCGCFEDCTSCVCSLFLRLLRT
uniref:Ferredoxin n=1 Tax=Macrostomum lignano TaxID=282301 RepID=A0A1I8FLR6_9PLAT